MDTPIPCPLPPLNEHQVKTLALLLRRALANGQLVLREQMLDAAGIETEAGESVAPQGATIEADEITFDDSSAPTFGVHLYVPGAALDVFADPA